MWGAVGGEVDADSTTSLPFLERKGLTRESSRQGRDETFTQLQQWLIPEATDPSEVGWGFVGDVLRNSGRRQFTSKLRMSAASAEPMASDMRRGELAPAGLNRRGAREISDMIAGSSVGDTQMGRASKGAAQSVGLGQDEVMQGRARSKMARIADRAESLEQPWNAERTSCAAATSAPNR